MNVYAIIEGKNYIVLDSGTMELKDCPWCGVTPEVEPQDPREQGNAWGSVFCGNKACPVRPIARDMVEVADDRGSEEYKRAAIKNWNNRR